jgi:hypothetical protein
LRLRPGQAALLISLICRFPQANRGAPQPELEETLKRLFASPEAKLVARRMLKRVGELTEREWTRAVDILLEQGVLATRDLLHAAGRPDPFEGLAPIGAINLYMRTLGWEGTRAGFRGLVKENALSALEQLARGKDIYFSLMQGLFTDELERTNAVVQLILQAVDSQEFMDELAELIDGIERRLLRSPEWVMALCLMERRRNMGGTAEMNEALETLREKHRGWLWACQSELRIPGRHIDIYGRDDLSQELSLAQQTVYTVLLKRAIEDPLGLLEDAWRGGLPFYLEQAIKNDIMQEIKWMKAGKRDSTHDVPLEAPLKKMKPDNQGIITPEDTVGDPSVDVEGEITGAEGVECLLRELSPVERQVIEMLVVEGHAQTTVAKKLDHGPSWVTKVKRRAFAKMQRALQDNAAVARPVARTAKTALKKRKTT